MLIACSGAFLLLISLLFKKLRESFVPLYVACAMIISSLMFFVTYFDDLKYSEKFIDTNAKVTGAITDEPEYSDSRYYYVIDLESIDENPIDVKLRLSLPYKLPAEPFDTVSLDAKIYRIASNSVEIQHYYYSKGIFLGAYTYNTDETSVSVTPNENESFEHRIYLIKQWIVNCISDKLPNEYGSTVIAMLLGDKSGLTDRRIESFREAGVAPIFAVSGMHLSIWVLGLYSVLQKFEIKKRLNSIIGIAFTILFMFLAGLSPSVCRSGIMMIMLLSANLFNRKNDSLNSLGFSAFILCLINPFTAIDVGFLLSFIATLAIVTTVPAFDRKFVSKIKIGLLTKPVKGIINSIAVSLSASIGVLPVTILFIGRVSLYSVLSNLLLNYVAAVCMVTGGFVALACKVTFISDFFALISGMLAKLMLTVIDFICEKPFTTLSTDNVFWKTGALCTVCAVVLSLIWFKRRTAIKVICVVVSAVIMLNGLSSYYYYKDLTQINILNVGNGISSVISTEGKKIALTGKADDYLKQMKIEETLNSINAYSTDLLILADKNAAYDSVNLSLIKSSDYNRIVLPVSNNDINSVCDKNKLTESANMHIEISDGGYIKTDIQKEYSVAYCSFNETSILMIFDSYKKAQIPDEYLNADFLVCCGYIPLCVPVYNYEGVVLCGDKKITAPIYNYVISEGGYPILADDYGKVVINVRGAKHKLFVMED